MNPKQFVKAYLPYAKETETKTGISAIAILTQAALESGWGKVAPNNMFFGIKDTDGVNGNEQLITTTEYTRSAKNPMPVAISKCGKFQEQFQIFQTKIIARIQ